MFERKLSLAGLCVSLASSKTIVHPPFRYCSHHTPRCLATSLCTSTIRLLGQLLENSSFNRVNADADTVHLLSSHRETDSNSIAMSTANTSIQQQTRPPTLMCGSGVQVSTARLEGFFVLSYIRQATAITDIPGFSICDTKLTISSGATVDNTRLKNRQLQRERRNSRLCLQPGASLNDQATTMSEDLATGRHAEITEAHCHFDYIEPSSAQDEITDSITGIEAASYPAASTVASRAEIQPSMTFTEEQQIQVSDLKPKNLSCISPIAERNLMRA